MVCKAGVRIVNPSISMLHAFKVVDAVWQKHFGHEAMLTSFEDGVHSEGSFHYEGEAGDFRIRKQNNSGLPTYEKRDLEDACATLRKELGNAFDVVLEDTHVHIEFQLDLR